MGVHVSTLPEDAPQALLDLDFDLHVAKCAAVVALSIALYDWIVCLDQEVELIWEAKQSIFKYLALICRYQALVFSILVAIMRLGDWTSEECAKFKVPAAIASDLVLLSVAYVLGLRTAALYSFDRNITIIIALTLLVQTVLAIWASNGWVVIEIPSEIPGCFVRPGLGPKLGVALYWFPAAVTDLVLLALTIARVSPICSFSNQSRLSFILVRDQVFYYSVVTSLTVALDLMLFIGQDAIAAALVPISLGLPPVLVFHLVLNLRRIGTPNSDQEVPIPMEEILATIQPVRSPTSFEGIGSSTRNAQEGGGGGGGGFTRSRFVRDRGGGRAGNADSEVGEASTNEISNEVFVTALTTINREE